MGELKATREPLLTDRLALRRPDKGLLARSQFRLLLDKAKEVTGLDDVTFHMLRRTGATWFAEEGAGNAARKLTPNPP